MTIWLLLALISALFSSWVQAGQKWAITLTRYSHVSIIFVTSLISSAILFLVSYFIVGLPAISGQFWLAVSVTGILNIIAWPFLLKAYELGEFSSVYSMILLTPLFMLFTSFLFLGEVPSPLGVLGVVLTVIGLWVISKKSHHQPVPNFLKGNLLGMAVALLWSVSVNFDKLSAAHSDAFFAPAMSTAIMAVGYAFYLLFRHGQLFVKEETAVNHDAGTAIHRLSPWTIICLLGMTMALSSIFHNAALLTGLASYTIAVKRLGILFGVLWGWLFFHEKDILKKMFGAAMAVAGVIAILVS